MHELDDPVLSSLLLRLGTGLGCKRESATLYSICLLCRLSPLSQNCANEVGLEELHGSDSVIVW